MQPNIVFLLALFILSPFLNADVLLTNPANSTVQYTLYTSIIYDRSDCGTPKDDLYLSTYNFGDGLYSAILSPNKSDAIVGYRSLTDASNNTDPNGRYFQLFDTGEDEFLLAMQMYYFDYAAWSPVAINLFNGTAGFYIDENGLQYDNLTWLACDWWYGMPQLFYMSDPFSLGFSMLPSSCSTIDLNPIIYEREDLVDG